MRRRSSVVRKLSGVVIAIITLVIATIALVYNLISNYYALESARDVLRFNSESIRGGIQKLMMSRNNDGVLELLQDVSRGSTVYRDLRLVSHYSGEIVVSRLQESAATRSEERHSCAICHDQSQPVVPSSDSLDEVIPGPGDARLLHVITPIMNEAACKNAACHAHASSGPILGFLEADYSLREFDTLIFGLDAFFVVAGLAAILLGITAIRVMFTQTLEKPIRHLIGGIQALAANDLSFRFKTRRNDEFGLVEESFDHMASRIRAQQSELRDAREYLEAIVENSADFIITANLDGSIQTVNRGAEEGLGYKRDELIGKPAEMLFVDPAERRAAIAKLESQDSVSNFETRFLAKSGAVKEVLLTLSRLCDRDGVAIGTLGISKDVTKEKELQERVTQSETAAAIGQAVTAIQHAIKNMLNTLTGGSYLVRHGLAREDPKRVEEGVEMIDDAISTISRLSLNMLKYAKPWTLEPSPTDLVLLVEDICRNIRQTAVEKGVTIHQELAEQLPPVSCDSKLIHMALLDIATNALDACDLKAYEGSETAEVAFAVYADDDAESIVVEIRDNGIGMTDEVKASIFKPFFTTKRQWGTGLGMALTSRVVALHGGTIDVESVPERGSTFRVVLPIAGAKQNPGF